MGYHCQDEVDTVKYDPKFGTHGVRVKFTLCPPHRDDQRRLRTLKDVKKESLYFNSCPHLPYWDSKPGAVPGSEQSGKDDFKVQRKNSSRMGGKGEGCKN